MFDQLDQPSPAEGPEPSRWANVNLPLQLAKVGFVLLILSFVDVNPILYPFRLFTGGPGGLYGTYTGVVRTGTPDAADPAPFAVAKLKLGPPLMSGYSWGFWQPSRQMDGALDLYFADGTHAHCKERLGTVSGAQADHFEMLVRGSAQPTEAINEAQVSDGAIDFSQGQCPDGPAPQTIFTGILQRSSATQVPQLVAQIPAAGAALRQSIAQQNQTLEGEWVGPVPAWNPDRGKQPANNAAMHLILSKIDESNGQGHRFTITGELCQAGGERETLKLEPGTFSAGQLEAEGNFLDADDSVFSRMNAGVKVTLVDDTLRVEAGRLELIILGTLRHGATTSYHAACAALNPSVRARR